MSQASYSDEAEATTAAELVRRVAAGERAAESELVERYSRGVLFLLRRLAQDPALAEDLHQEVFVVALERLRAGGLQQPERLSGFLRATARNLLTGDFRKRARRDTHSDSEQVDRAVDPRFGALNQVLREEKAKAVREALSELRTERDRQILFHYYLLEKPKETICSELDLTELHFNRVLFRARQRFRQILERGEPRHSGASS